jgi:hypothetical protein
MQMMNKLQDADVTIDEWERRIIVKVPVFFFIFHFFLQLLRVLWKPRKILSNLMIDQFYTILFYTVTHLATTYALSLTTLDKLCEKQCPSGSSDRCIPNFL